MLNLPGIKADMIFHVTDANNKHAPVLVSAYYFSNDPYAITLSFDVGTDEAVEWVFARQLLFEGIHQPAGQGDVKIWPQPTPDGDGVCIDLSSPGGHALFESSVSPLLRFLEATRALVPVGQEFDFLDLESELKLFLSRKSWKGV